jgi:hypothetical protein
MASTTSKSLTVISKSKQQQQKPSIRRDDKINFANKVT